jgi:hypothetical protein
MTLAADTKHCVAVERAIEDLFRCIPRPFRESLRGEPRLICIEVGAGSDLRYTDVWLEQLPRGDNAGIELWVVDPNIDATAPDVAARIRAIEQRFAPLVIRVHCGRWDDVALTTPAHELAEVHVAVAIQTLSIMPPEAFDRFFATIGPRLRSGALLGLVHEPEDEITEEKNRADYQAYQRTIGEHLRLARAHGLDLLKVVGQPAHGAEQWPSPDWHFMASILLAKGPPPPRHIPSASLLAGTPSAPLFLPRDETVVALQPTPSGEDAERAVQRYLQALASGFSMRVAGGYEYSVRPADWTAFVDEEQMRALAPPRYDYSDALLELMREQGLALDPDVPAEPAPMPEVAESQVDFAASSFDVLAFVAPASVGIDGGLKLRGASPNESLLVVCGERLVAAAQHCHRLLSEQQDHLLNGIPSAAETVERLARVVVFHELGHLLLDPGFSCANGFAHEGVANGVAYMACRDARDRQVFHALLAGAPARYLFWLPLFFVTQNLGRLIGQVQRREGLGICATFAHLPLAVAPFARGGEIRVTGDIHGLAGFAATDVRICGRRIAGIGHLGPRCTVEADAIGHVVGLVPVDSVVSADQIEHSDVYDLTKPPANLRIARS